MKQKFIQVRISETLKKQFDEINSKRHINGSDLIRGWIRDYVKESKK